MIEHEIGSFSAEQTMFEESVERFLSAKCDFAARARRLASSSGWDEELWHSFAEMGWLGLEVPEEYGGAGLSPSETLLLMQKFGKYLVTEPFLASAVLGTYLVCEAATHIQKQALLPPLTTGDLRIAVAFAEPQAGYATANIQAKAVPDGSGWRLEGEKCMVLGAPAATALVIPAVIVNCSLEHSGHASLFLLNPDADGLTMRSYRTVSGLIAADLRMHGIWLPKENLLGEEGVAVQALARAIDRSTAATVAEAAGAMRGALEITRDYLKVRSQYGHSLASYQVLRHRLADMHIATEEAFSMACLASSVCTNIGAIRSRLAISVAKSHAASCGRIVGQGAVQLHGAMGIMDDYPVGHYLKQLTAFDRIFGDRNYHLDRYTALERIGDDPSIACSH